jgi:pectate lyase
MKRLLGLLILSLALSACGGGGGGPVNVTGDWSGTWTSSRGSGSTLSATLLQSGTSVSGTAQVGGSPCLSTGDVSGTVSGSGATFGVVSGSHGITFTANRITASSMTGTYSVSSGWCAGDSGSFSLTR